MKLVPVQQRGVRERWRGTVPSSALSPDEHTGIYWYLTVSTTIKTNHQFMNIQHLIGERLLEMSKTSKIDCMKKQLTGISSLAPISNSM